MFSGLAVHRFEGNRSHAICAGDVYRGVQRDKPLRKITGISGDASIADTKNSVFAIDAFESRATGAWLSLVAGAPGWIAEITAPRALQYIAAEGSHVAQLRAGGQLQRLSDDGIVAPNDWVRGR